MLNYAKEDRRIEGVREINSIYYYYSLYVSHSNRMAITLFYRILFDIFNFI